jgi:hypothetical protein
MSILFRFVLDAIEYQQLTLALRDDVSGAFIPQPTDLPYHKKERRLSRHQTEAILDAVGDLLCAKGITDGELNTYGLWLEPLLDLVNAPLHR